MPRPADQRHGRGTVALVISWWRLVPSYGWDGTGADPRLGRRTRQRWSWFVGEVLVCRVRPPCAGRWGRVKEFGRVEGLGRVEQPGLARAGLRGVVGPVVFEKDPGSVACLGFIPPTSAYII